MLDIKELKNALEELYGSTSSLNSKTNDRLYDYYYLLDKAIDELETYENSDISLTRELLHIQRCVSKELATMYLNQNKDYQYLSEDVRKKMVNDLLDKVRKEVCQC